MYTLKDDSTNKVQIGMIAQEVEEFFPELIEIGHDGFKCLNYSKLSVICLRLIKELSINIKLLSSKYDEIINKIK